MALVGVSEQGRLTVGEKTMGELARETAEKAKVQASQIRLPEFLLFASLIYGQSVPGIGLPFNQLMVFVIVGYALTRRPVFELGKWSKIFVILGLLLAYVALVSAFADPSEYASDWTRRFLRLVAMTGLIYVIAVGQIHLRSAILGYSSALLVNAILYFAGIAPDTYEGYLTGFLGDKNYAGLVHAVFALLVMSTLTRRWEQIAVFVVSWGLLWTTGSRTSLAALAFGYLWVLLAPRLLPVIKVGLLGVFWWLLNLITEDYSQAEVFGDRSGTDYLRSQIDAMSWAKVQVTGFWGQGLGEAYVYDVERQKPWLFHNSYWSAFVEGGWIWVLGVVAVTLLVAVRPLSNNDWTVYQVIAQGVGIALLVCALRLGEVFYTLPWAICMGYVVRVSIIERYDNQYIKLFGYDKLIN